jgi:ankyrin repeat protein
MIGTREFLQSKLFASIANDDLFTLDLLLRAGADLDLACAAKPYGPTPAIWAAQNSSWKSLSRLVELGCDLAAHDNHGIPALHYAASQPSATGLNAILSAGFPAEFATASGRTAAHAAASHGQTASLMILATSGADLDRADAEGITPSMAAAYCEHPDALAWLAEQGCDFSALDIHGRDVLAHASFHGWGLCAKIAEAHLERLALARAAAPASPSARPKTL